MGETISTGDRVVAASETRGLEELEGIIGHGLGTFVEVGRALLEIQHRRLYLQAGHRSFAVYMSERWDLSESHAYRQIEAAKVINLLSPMGELASHKRGSGTRARSARRRPRSDPRSVVRDRSDRRASDRASDPREGGRTARTSPDDPLALRLHDFACLPSLRAHVDGRGWLVGMRRGTNAGAALRR
jgi:hypothetical protein